MNSGPQHTDPVLQTKISDLDFTTLSWVGNKMNTRIINGLQRAGIMTLEELVIHTAPEVSAMTQGVGIICMEAIRQKLKQMKLSLRRSGQR